MVKEPRVSTAYNAEWVKAGVFVSTVAERKNSDCRTDRWTEVVEPATLHFIDYTTTALSIIYASRTGKTSLYNTNSSVKMY
jgi:hypothetical protein